MTYVPFRMAERPIFVKKKKKEKKKKNEVPKITSIKGKKKRRWSIRKKTEDETGNQLQ